MKMHTHASNCFFVGMEHSYINGPNMTIPIKMGLICLRVKWVS